MGYHADYIYRPKDRKFDVDRNRQVIDTPTVLLSLGDTRKFRWKRRMIIIITHRLLIRKLTSPKGLYALVCSAEKYNR